jgi:hypothetical protein
LLQIVHDPERIDRLRDALSGFCHRCRNSLNGIKMSLYLFRREARGAVPECWDDLETIYQQTVHLFDHLQAIYRPMTITMVRSPLDALILHHVPKWRSWFESRGQSIQLDPPESEVPGDFDPAQLGAGLDAMAAWRAESCDPGTSTRIAWTARDGSVELCWEEVVAHHAPDWPEFAGRCGPRGGNPAVRRVDLLELPLLARIVAEHGGRIHCTRGPAFRLRLRWPQFRRADPQGDA